MIDAFEGENFFLSNDFLSSVEYEGVLYPSVEHAFQAAKVNDPKLRNQFTRFRSAEFARRVGSQLTAKAGWDNEKFKVLDSLMVSKFTNNQYLKTKLLGTGNQIILNNDLDAEEINRLGIMLMDLRYSLSKQPVRP